MHHPQRTVPRPVRTAARRRVPAALLATAALVLSLLAVTGQAPASAAPPKNPTDAQLNQAANQKAALANQVGALTAQVAEQQTKLRKLQDDQEMAEQKLAYALSLLEQAKQDATAAKAAVAAAQRRVDAAQQQFAAFASASYMSGSIGGTTGSLLTATDPNSVLEQSALQSYESDHQLNAIDSMKAATVAKSNADAKARAAVEKQNQAAQAAQQAKDDAVAAVIAGKAQEKQLQASLAQNQQNLQAAQLKLATLNNQRKVFLAYQAHQRWLAHQRYLAHLRALAAAKAAAERAARLAAQLAAQRAAQEAAQRQQQQQQNNGGGGGGGGSTSGGGGGGGGYSGPSGGGWSAQRGIEAAARAQAYLGIMYAWDGGNAYGPTYGVCAGDGAWNDCHIKGFDCSGLALYAWAPFESMPHYAAAQYGDAGSYHPSISNLMPGDLVFWSSDGTVGGIHHVAIYVGGGNVIQAPQSGSVVQITPVLQVDWGLFGATRPLT